jgi:DNA-binding GntR family transcriptional regulator
VSSAQISSPADRTRTDGDAYERIRAAILTGRLAPGEIYSQADLTRLLGVSRTPLREATRRLQSEGFFEHEPKRRLRVSPLEAKDLSALYAMRIALEPLAVRLAMPFMARNDHALLQSHLSAMHAACAAGDYEASRIPHREFHQLLYSRAGERIVREVQELRDHAERYRRLVFADAADSVAMLGAAAGEHDAIAEAALDRDGDRCTELVAQHLSRSALKISAELEQSFEPRAVRTALQYVRFGTAQGSRTRD